MRLWMGPRASMDVFGEEEDVLARIETFLFSQNIHTGPGTHTNSCPIGIGVSSVGAKRPVRVHHSPPSSGEVKNECSYVNLHLPHALTTSARKTLPFYFYP
jgi:hypothetical protein